MREWIAIAHVASLEDANLMKSRLQASGIDIWFDGEVSADIAPGGRSRITVMVPEDQVEEAHHLLDVVDEDSDDAAENGAIDETLSDEAYVSTEADEEGQADPDPRERWVTVAQYPMLNEADIVCGRLQAEGLHARIKDEYVMVLGAPMAHSIMAAVAANAFSVLPDSTPSVIVPAAQAEKAIAMIRAMELVAERMTREEASD